MYQNRWASYGKSPATFSYAKPIRDTFTAKERSSRYEQDEFRPVGGRSQERTNSVRRPRKDWPSSRSSRSIKLGNQIVDLCPAQNIDFEMGHTQESKLIEVFDKELARLSTMTSRKVEDQVPMKTLKPLSDPTRRCTTADATKTPQEEIIDSSVIDRIHHLSEKLHSLNQGSHRDISHVLQTFQRSVHAALEVFYASIQEITKGLEEKAKANFSTSVDNEKRDELKLEETIKDLQETATLLRMQLLPTLRKCAERSLRQNSEQAASPVLPGLYHRCLTSQWGSKPSHSSQPNRLVQQLEKNHSTLEMADGPMSRDLRTCEASRSTNNLAIGPAATNPSGTCVLSLAKTRSMSPKYSCSDGARKSAGVREAATSLCDDNAPWLAERRFPTLEHIEQEGSVVVHQPPDDRPPLVQLDCGQSSRTANHEGEITYPTFTLKHQSGLSTPSCMSGSHLPIIGGAASERSTYDTPSNVGGACQILPWSSKSDGQPDWRHELQSPTFVASSRGAVPGQQERCGGYPELKRLESHVVVLGGRALHGTDRIDGRQPCQSQDHSDAGISETLADAVAIGHDDAATVARTQACVEELQKLGFGSAAEGGSNRLVIYAQATGGDLIEAIDMIAEERQAYDQTFNRRFLA